MPLAEESYVSKHVTSADFAAAVEEVVAAFAAQGFGVLTRTDAAETLKNRLGIDRPPYVILGMCNPTLAHRALEIEPDVGALLPCNVAVYELDDAVVISAQDPGIMVGVTGNLELDDVAAEASERVEAAMGVLRERLK